MRPADGMLTCENRLEEFKKQKNNKNKKILFLFLKNKIVLVPSFGFWG